MDSQRQSKMAAGICTSCPQTDKGDIDEDQDYAGEVSSEVADVQGGKQHAQPVGRLRSHTDRWRLLVGQQSHREDQPICIAVKKDLALLRKPCRSKKRLHLLLACMLLQTAPDKLLRTPVGYTQQDGGAAAYGLTTSLQGYTSRPMEKERAGSVILLFFSQDVTAETLTLF